MKTRAIRFVRVVPLALVLWSLHSSDLKAAESEPSEVYALLTSMGGLALQPDGKIVVTDPSAIYAVNTITGTISLIRGGAARFNPDGSLDRSFHCNLEGVSAIDVIITHLKI